MKRITFSVISVVLVMVLALGAAAPAAAVGTAPVAENLEIKTYRNVSVGGRLSAYDPDGGVVSYEITTEPVKGELRISEKGLFVYTPNENKRGRDYFGYKAIDGDGNYSQEATVIIRIEKQKKDVYYSDMNGSGEEYAAVALSEMGVFTGAQVCGQYRFEPDKAVSREEFLAMCMTVSEKPLFTSVLSTGFADDGEIEGWMKGYVATAAMYGAPISDSAGDERTFRPDDAITVEDAALMLDSIMDITPVYYPTADGDGDTAAARACMNLSACGVLSAEARAAELLSRAEAAQMLVSAAEVLSNRDK